MKIEVLFPEVCNLYGDLANIRYLKESVDTITIIETKLTDEPYFMKNKPDLIYMGGMTEHSQELVINKLKDYKDRIYYSRLYNYEQKPPVYEGDNYFEETLEGIRIEWSDSEIKVY